MKLRIAYGIAVWAFWVIGLIPLAHAQPLTPICSQHREYVTACAVAVDHDALGPMMGYQDHGKWNFMRQKDYDKMITDKH